MIAQRIYISKNFNDKYLCDNCQHDITTEPKCRKCKSLDECKCCKLVAEQLLPEEQIALEKQIHYKTLNEAISKRFPNAQFTISCFKTIDEIEEKLLCRDCDQIIIVDSFYVNGKKKYDYFVVDSEYPSNHIYYCDVIDELIRNDFKRNHVDHKFLEGISRTGQRGLYKSSVKVFGFSWGS